MLWNAAVVLTIIVAFGSALFALATDLGARVIGPSEGNGWERGGILDRVLCKTTRPAGGYLSGRHRPPLIVDARSEPRASTR